MDLWGKANFYFLVTWMMFIFSEKSSQFSTKTPVVIPNKPVHFFLIRAMESTFPTALSISLVVNVILGIIFSGMYIFLYPGMTSTEENPEVQEARLTSRSPTNNEFCVSCDYLGQSLFTSNTLYTDVVTVNCGNEHRLCCYNDTVLQRFIFSAANEVRNTNEISDDISSLKNQLITWRNREHAAHLYLDTSKPLSKDKYARWQISDPLGSSFKSSKISLEKDSTTIRVSAAGEYYIYSSLKILQGYTAQSENFNIILGKKRKSNANSSLESLQTKRFKLNKRDPYEFVLFRGIVYLEAEFEVGIKVQENAKNLIDVSSSLSNYFGIYKVE